ncbi:MAG TPA: serine/threonine-protein kinase [Gemmataceae bacterium]|nr:serine/threonine-protein kinase [Gemmataceae bacterium]
MLVGKQYGPFTIDKELGSGAMGTVYRGRYTKTGQIMAIKVMAPGIGSTNAAAADRFEREITVLKQLNHPNIVRFYGAGKQEGARYFAMEYIEGESLDKVMARRDRMTWEEVVALGQQLCSALQHAHEKGIIHRDLKPSNIMVLPDGTLKLTDFGIAKDSDLEALTATNCTVGTAAYMSPEQCKGQSDLTHKSDLYSLGVLFYELLTGRKPFKADNAMDMFLQHVQGTFERPSHMVLDIPVWLDTLVCQLMEKKTEQRPLDAHLVAETLGSIQEKVEAQQSAGVEAVRRRMIDRQPGQKRPDEEDKEAARILMTGKGRSKRKRTKKKLYEQVWFRAVGLLLALAVAGTLLFLAFRPPSADKLYSQAEKLMKSGKEEDRDKALKGPIKEYLQRYPNRNDQQAQTIRGWDDQIESAQCEERLERYLNKERNKSAIRLQPSDETEKNAFAAAKAEDEGKIDDDKGGARQLWREVKRDGPSRWGLVADKHLDDLQALDAIDTQFQQIHDRIRDSGKEQPLPDLREKQAFQAWRAEHCAIEDRRLARSLFQSLKEETMNESGQHRWFLYAAWNVKQLADASKDKEQMRDKVKMLLEKTREELKAKKIPKEDALLFCLDILALYEKDEDMKLPVKEAGKLRDELKSE